MVGLLWGCDEMMDVVGGGVEEKVHASFNADPKLTLCEKVCCQCGAVLLHDDGPYNSAEGCADANGSKLGRLLYVFV